MQPTIRIVFTRRDRRYPIDHDWLHIGAPDEGHVPPLETMVQNLTNVVKY